jgi:hypothetical protein
MQTLMKNAFAFLPVENMPIDRFCASVLVGWFYGPTTLLTSNAASSIPDIDRSKCDEIFPPGAGKGEVGVSKDSVRKAEKIE